MLIDLETLFPGLRGKPYQITSPPTRRYNCIAWAAGDAKSWWWPELDVENGFWPKSVPAELTLPAFQAVFTMLGYLPTDRDDLESGWLKVALFATSEGIPTHAARQLSTGRWTSKIGYLEDIEHELHDLAGTEYGTVVLVMKRPSPADA